MMKNLLLSLFSPSDLKRLEPHLKPARFEQHHVLFEADEPISHVYFPTSAVVSLVVTLSSGDMIEAAMVGNDGVVGASAALDGKIAPSRGIIQLGGEIVVCDIDALKSIALQSPKMLALLIRHEQAVFAQAQQSAACFATHRAEDQRHRGRSYAAGSRLDQICPRQDSDHECQGTAGKRLRMLWLGQSALSEAAWT